MQTGIKTESRRRLHLPGRVATTVILAGGGMICGIMAGTMPLPLTLTIVAGIIAVALSVCRPDLTLSLFFCGIVMMTDAVSESPGDFFAIQDVDIIDGLPSALMLFFLLMIGITLVRILFIERSKPPISLRGLGVYTIVIFIALVTGLLKSSDRGLIHFDFMKMLFPVLCFYLCRIILNSRERIHRMLIVLVAVSTLKALILSAAYLAGRGWLYSMEGYASFRITTMDSADLLAFITLILIIAHLLVRGDLRRGPAILLGATCIPLLYVLIFSYRRAQWVGMIFSLGLLYCGASKAVRNKVLVLLLITLFAGSSIMALSGTGRIKVERIALRLTSIFDEEQSSNQYHLMESQQVLKDLSTAPVTGLGLGSHHSRLPGYDVDVVPTNIVHNTALYIWMKMGLAGLAFYLWAATRHIKCILRYRTQYIQNKNWGLILPLGASGGLWLAMILTGPIPWYLHQTFLLALFAAMTISLIQQTEMETKNSHEK